MVLSITSLQIFVRIYYYITSATYETYRLLFDLNHDTFNVVVRTILQTLYHRYICSYSPHLTAVFPNGSQYLFLDHNFITEIQLRMTGSTDVLTGIFDEFLKSARCIWSESVLYKINCLSSRHITKIYCTVTTFTDTVFWFQCHYWWWSFYL